MRPVFAVLVLVGAAALCGGAQPIKDPPARYGVAPRVRLYLQNTPKDALKATIELADDGLFGYLAAHILDPKFVDDMVNDRAKGFEPLVERELAQLRDFQRANPDKYKPEDRIPQDPKDFRALAADKARDLAFKQLQADIAKKFKDDPQTLKDMRKLWRDGTFTVGDPTASVTHDSIKGRALYFRKVGDRWFLENKQTADEPKKEP